MLTRDLADRAPERVSATIEAGQNWVVAPADPIGLSRVIANLIDNAMRYAFSTRVTLGRDGDRIRLVVDDDGPGVPEHERDAIFEPFHRLEPSRNRETGGSGLGLAIARQILERHAGSITVASSPQGGARFIVTLPAAQG